MIELKSAQELDKMRESGRLCANCMEKLIAHVKPGVSTKQLDSIAEQFIEAAGAIPSFKNYRGFPASICASVNDEVVHGIPGDKVLKEGDIIGIDFGAILDGWHSDMARTVGVGEIAEEAKALIRVTKESFCAGMNQAVQGNRLRDISSAVEKVAKSHGYSVVRDLVGHGIGRSMHEQPDVPNFTFRGPNPRLLAGMVLAIEPMVNIGGAKVFWGEDGWVVKTADGSLSAHYENTVAITENGPEILTKVW
ncbi:MAG TPA: type I methionyl aminopeptidase [Clostridiales bacterium]|nr:type I methionyl aminopeptidase [Clostridiales bacterium]